jgi:hypothetical protein
VIKYIDNADFRDEFAYVLHSDEVLTNHEARVGGGLEYVYMNFILTHLDADNALSVIDHLITNGKTLENIAGRTGFPVENTLINKLYILLGEINKSRGSDFLMGPFTRFLITLDFHSHTEKKWGTPVLFFELLDKKERYFWEFLWSKNEDKLNYFLPDLYNESLDGEIFQKYENGKLSDVQIFKIRYAFADRDKVQHDRFQQKLLERYGNKFKYTESVNWDKINSEREKRDILLLGDRDLFLNEAKKVYKLIREIKGNDDDEERLYQIEYSDRKEIRKKVNSNLIFRVISEYKITGGYTVFKEIFTPDGWEWYRFQQVEEYLIHNKKHLLPASLLTESATYLEKNIMPFVNFNEAVVDVENDSYTLNDAGIRLSNYYRHGAIDLPEDLQLDLLLFDFDGYAYDTQAEEKKYKRLFELIHERTNPARFKNRVLMNLQRRELSIRVLTNHAYICRYYEYEEGLPEMLQMLDNKNCAGRYKIYIVEMIIKLADTPDIFDHFLSGLESINDHWELMVVNYLAQFSSYRKKLIKIIDNSFLNPVIEGHEIFWKHELIKKGIRLGSMNAIVFQFDNFFKNLRISDFASLKADDFKVVVEEQPDWLMTQCLEVLRKVAPFLDGRKHNELPEIMEDLVRQCAVKSKDLFKRASTEYQKIITDLYDNYPKVTYINWFNRRLINHYYQHVISYESDEQAWEIISSLYTTCEK